MRYQKLCWVLLACQVFLASEAVAQSKNKPSAEALKKAKERFDEAEAFYRVGEYQKALEGYKEAYLLAKKPAILFNMAQCHRYLKNYQEAIQTYELFLADEPNTPVREEVEGFILESKNALAAQTKVDPNPQPTTIEAPKTEPAKTIDPGAITTPIPKTYDGPKKNTFFLAAGATAVMSGVFGAAAIITANKATSLQLQIEEPDDPNIERVLNQFRRAQIMGGASDLLLATSVISAGAGAYFSWKQKQFDAKIQVQPNAVTLWVGF